jgi:putative DNA primase/helicase
MRDFGSLMRQVAPLLGYDPEAADRKGEARYRPHGSLRINYRHGLFSDYAAGDAGGVLDFIKRETGEQPREWLQRNHIEAPAPTTERRAPPRRREDDGAERRDLDADEQERAAAARAIWEQAVPIAGVSAVEDYLRSRCLEPIVDQLRFHAKTPWRAQTRPCLLAAYRSIDTDGVTGIARILVDEPERWPKTQRKMLGVVRRAAVKLAPATDTLAVGEGVETCMAANLLGHGPAWALGSAGAIANLPVLPGIRRLILLAEHNEASRAATDRCGQRWLRAGRKVARVWPAAGCDDLNDELMQKRNA